MTKRSEQAVRAAETTRARAAARVAVGPKPAVSGECVIYARVSSKDQEKEGFSIPSQLRTLHDYAAQHHLKVHAEYIDVETAKRAGRTNFNRMLAELADRPSCRTIVVEKTDRLYRNISDWVTLDALKLEIHLVKEGVVLSDGSRSSEKFIHGIKVLMAKNYIDNLSEEVKKGLREKATQGIWPGIAPLGLRNVTGPDGKKIIELDPENGPRVLRLFEAYATGDVSLADLVRRAKDDGLKSKKGKALATVTIWAMLQNPLYMGEFDWEGKRIVGAHQPLITKELYEQVQYMLTGRKQVARTTQFRDFAFSGTLHCGLCADEGEVYLLVAEQHRGKYTYYTCTRCKKLDRVVYFREAVVAEAFITEFNRVAMDAEMWEMLRTALLETHGELVAARDREVARINRGLADLRTKVDRAYDDRLEGRIPADVFDRKAAGWREDEDRLRRELTALDKADAATMGQGLDLLELGNLSVQLWEQQDVIAKRKLIVFLAQNCAFSKNGLVVNWRKPFDLLPLIAAELTDENGRKLAFPADRSKWLPDGFLTDKLDHRPPRAS